MAHFLVALAICLFAQSKLARTCRKVIVQLKLLWGLIAQLRRKKPFSTNKLFN